MSDEICVTDGQTTRLRGSTPRHNNYFPHDQLWTNNDYSCKTHSCWDGFVILNITAFSTDHHLLFFVFISFLLGSLRYVWRSVTCALIGSNGIIRWRIFRLFESKWIGVLVNDKMKTVYTPQQGRYESVCLLVEIIPRDDEEEKDRCHVGLTVEIEWVIECIV